jgi:hypothetical protein
VLYSCHTLGALDRNRAMQLDFDLTETDAIADAFGANVFIIGELVRDRLLNCSMGRPTIHKDNDCVVTVYSLREIHERLAGVGKLDAVGLAVYRSHRVPSPTGPALDRQPQHRLRRSCLPIRCFTFYL